MATGALPGDKMVNRLYLLTYPANIRSDGRQGKKCRADSHRDYALISYPELHGQVVLREGNRHHLEIARVVESSPRAFS